MNSPREMNQAPDKDRVPLSRFVGPRFWGVWIALGIVRLILFLPIRTQLGVGRAAGRLAYRLSRRDRHIADVNIALCLPELSPQQRADLNKRHFEALGCSVLEIAWSWWLSDARLQPLFRMEGLEHLERARAQGKGALILSAHFTTLEMGGRALAGVTPVSIMYQPPPNPLIGEFVRRNRAARSVQAIASDQIRDLLQNLKNNVPVWYAPDQRYTDKYSAVVPFFGHPAASNIATSRLARISQAPVLPYFPERLADGTYLVRIGAPLENFPSEDAVADTLRFHRLIEEHVRRCPDQYLWTYKRFKLPGPGGDPYKRSA